MLGGRHDPGLGGGAHRSVIEIPSTIHLLSTAPLAPIESGPVLAMPCARAAGSALARASFTAFVPAMMKVVEGALAGFKECRSRALSVAG